jgi:hypothetical protein
MGGNHTPSRKKAAAGEGLDISITTKPELNICDGSIA